MVPAGPPRVTDRWCVLPHMGSGLLASACARSPSAMAFRNPQTVAACDRGAGRSVIRVRLCWAQPAHALPRDTAWCGRVRAGASGKVATGGQAPGNDSPGQANRHCR